MRRLLFACLALALGLAVPVAAPTPAHAVTININIGTSLNNGRAITCRDGERILRSRGFRDIRRVDCRGRFFVYRARHRRRPVRNCREPRTMAASSTCVASEGDLPDRPLSWRPLHATAGDAVFWRASCFWPSVQAAADGVTRCAQTPEQARRIVPYGGDTGGNPLLRGFLTPSLIPRSYLVQGVLSGFSAALGYGIGVLAFWLWTYLELPQLTGPNPEGDENCSRRRVRRDCRRLPLEDPGVAEFDPHTDEPRSAGYGKPSQDGRRRCRRLCHPDVAGAPLQIHLPRVLQLAWALRPKAGFQSCRRPAGDRAVLVGGRRTGFQADAENSGLLVPGDSMLSSTMTLPGRWPPFRTGSAASLLSWEDLGRQGRRFVSSGPTRRGDRRFLRARGFGPDPRVCRNELGRHRR